MRGILKTMFAIVGAASLSTVVLIWPAKAEVSVDILNSPLCACCTDEGEWYEISQGVADYDLTQLGRIRFASSAKTFLGRGDDVELSENVSLNQTRSGRRWKLRFRDETGKIVNVSFLIPPTAVSFGADLHEGGEAGLGPLLYKEWRFSGRAQVDGVFSRRLGRSPRFQLIFQGRGRGCPEAEDYKNWTLKVAGPRITYQFYGALDPPSS